METVDRLGPKATRKGRVYFEDPIIRGIRVDAELKSEVVGLMNRGDSVKEIAKAPLSEDGLIFIEISPPTLPELIRNLRQSIGKYKPPFRSQGPPTSHL